MSRVVLRGAAVSSLLWAVQAKARLHEEDSTTPFTLPLYDCSVEYDLRETAWSPDWQAWCCEHEARGCRSTTTTTHTTSTPTSTTRTSTSRTSTSRTFTSRTMTTTTVETCHELCPVDGVSATCAARLLWAAQHETVVSHCEFGGGGPREALRGGPHPCPGPVLAVWRLLGRGCHVQERCGHR
mmetsp:Transcript_22847/g.63896  ORF Transcript_22847/g.63896 Transcript_22847/m.63896 type:complete len:183 (-) Transcript_22847:293-841(-)